ncbi:MAG: ASCH domain-containing protein [Lachnospiraceae bacterium]|nr:ASCH domain-containing protein [Lachnospiraceae bacterium]
MLILTIKKQWFDMIAVGVKKEEYRDIKPYYTSRFTSIGLLDKTSRPTNTSVWIMFRNGYSKSSPTLKALCRLDVKQGNTTWGAEPDTTYYTLKIEETENDRKGE